MAKELLVSEIFGPTFQGEGPSLGQRTAFLRLMTCNLACTWCDTAFTWDWTRFKFEDEVTRMTPDQIADEVNLLGVDRLVISGGEPMIQQKKLPAVLSLLSHSKSYQFEIETAGTLVPDIEMHRRDIQWNVSPKLEHSGNPYDKRFVPDALHALNALQANFKFVVQKVSDLDEVQDIANMIGIPRNKVFIMPEGTEPEVIDLTARNIADAVLIQGWNFTTRLHVQLWGDVRGK